ncbi:hypothetical protein Hdeb2414_s0006g00203621 [Helianthus debilis subsp. tardiflorus]
MMNDNASVTSSSLAVVEKTPRKNGGCVGMFFQLFDWNRRFTKKKLFSKRLPAPGRVNEGLKKFGGDEKLPKLLLIADENSGGFPFKNKNDVNGVQTPNLVARLMGLESMPSVHHDKPHKDHSDEFKPHKQDSTEFRPQKIQKTAIVDRKSVTRFGAEALQLKHVLSQSRKHHHPKLASPVTSTSHRGKRNSSRLIGAATRILEPGLQARNKSKYVISYGQGARRPLGNGLRSEPVKGEDLDLLSRHASCKNCGNLIDVGESTSKRDMIKNTNGSNLRYDQEHEFSTNGVSIDRGYFQEDNRDQVKMNTGLSGQTRSRVMPKGGDMKFESARVNCSSPRPKRRVMHTRTQWESCGIVGSSINGPRMVRTAQSKQDYRGQIVNKNLDDGMTFRFSSPMKKNPNATPCKPTSRKRVPPNPSYENIRAQKPLSVTVAGYESGIYGRTQNDRNHHRCGHDHCTGFCLQPVCFPSSRYETSFSNDSCCSSSFEDSSVRTQHADSMSYSYDDESQYQESETDPFCSGVVLRKENTHSKLVTDLLTYISQVLSSIDLVNSKTKRNIKEIVFNSELVLGSQTPHNPNEINSFFICDLLLELDALTKVMWTRFGNFLGSKNSNARYQLKRFVFDSLIEYLESKYVRYAKCGFRAWMNLPPFMGFDSLVYEVVEEVRGWMSAASDEVVVPMDMSRGSGQWSDFEIEAYETGAKVEWDIVETLIDEIVVDVSTNFRPFRV